MRETFDTVVKRTASRKPILALLLSRLLDEFQGLSIQDILSKHYIEPPRLGEPADPADDAEYDTRIVGACSETNEDGTVAIYDILFDARTPQGDWLRINIEIQNKMESYDLVKRIIYYLSREVSSQKGRNDFVKSNYDALRGACSVWICIHPYSEERDSIAKIGLDLSWIRPEGKVTDPADKQKINRLLRAYIVNLPKPDAKSDPKDWLNTLSILFGHEIPIETKEKFLKTQGIVKDSELTEDMHKMTTLDELYREELAQRLTQRLTQQLTQQLTQRITQQVTEKVTQQVTEKVTQQVTERERAKAAAEAQSQVEETRKECFAETVRHLAQRGYDSDWIVKNLGGNTEDIRKILAAQPMPPPVSVSASAPV